MERSKLKTMNKLREELAELRENHDMGLNTDNEYKSQVLDVMFRHIKSSVIIDALVDFTCNTELPPNVDTSGWETA